MAKANSGKLSIGVQSGAVFFFGELQLPELEAEDLALDWGNTLFVVGVSLAVVVVVLFVFPKLRGIAQPQPKVE